MILVPLIVTVAAVAVVSQLKAQADRPARLVGSSLALTVNRFGLDEDSRTAQVTLRFTALKRPSVLSPDVALGVLDEGQTAVTLELGPAVTLTGRSALLLLRFGAMGLQTSAGTAGGGYVGLSTLIRLRGRLGIRLDVARQEYFAAAGSVGMWQFGGGIALLPAVR